MSWDDTKTTGNDILSADWNAMTSFVKNTSFFSTSSTATTSFALTGSVSPVSSLKRVLLVASNYSVGSSSVSANISLYRGTGSSATFLARSHDELNIAFGNDLPCAASVSFIDTPATTTSTTYVLVSSIFATSSATTLQAIVL